MLVNVRVECDVEMLLGDRISVRDFGLTDFHSAEPELSNYRKGGSGTIAVSAVGIRPVFSGVSITP